ncbi:heavy metal translocating P-type ATPase [Lachnospiraceae bacterium C1.1]|nr:heavy metal translocating P-type ATPase [Lachnospiraceae bacterium C1.1]
MLRYSILHKSGESIRTRIYLPDGKAETLYAAKNGLRRSKNVKKVKVHERSSVLIIYFERGYEYDVIERLNNIDPSLYTEADNSLREIDRKFEDKIFFKVLNRFVIRRFIPIPIRRLRVLFKTVKYVKRAVKALSERKLNGDVLNAVTIIVSLATGNFEAANSTMFLMDLCSLLSKWSYNRSIRTIAADMIRIPDKVWIRNGGADVEVNSADVKIGDFVIVRTGMMIPFDGVIESGTVELLDCSSTDHCEMFTRSVNDYVYAGMTVRNGECEICVRETSGKGHYERIFKMLKESRRIQNSNKNDRLLIDKSAAFTFGAVAFTQLITGNVNRAQSVLSVDFGDVKELTVPISTLSAIKECSESSVKVKSGKLFEEISKADTVIFNKAGTLTYAKPKLKKIITFAGRDENEMLRLAACLEEHYPHYIAGAVVREAEKRGLEHSEMHAHVEYLVSHGLISSVDGERVVIGSHHFIFTDEKCHLDEAEKVKYRELPDENSYLFMAVNGEVTAAFCIEDKLREESKAVIDELKRLGIKKFVMMTGDSERTARAVAGILGFDEFYANVLPEDKTEFVRKEKEAGHVVIMTGDGISDTAALAEANVGISVESGAELAKESADIIIPDDNLEKLLYLRKISILLDGRVKNNLQYNKYVNASLMAMGFLGILPQTMGGILHNSLTLALSARSMTDLMEY